MGRIRLWEVMAHIRGKRGKKVTKTTDMDFTSKQKAESYARRVKARHGNARVILSHEKKMGIPGVPTGHKKKAGGHHKAHTHKRHATYGTIRRPAYHKVAHRRTHYMSHHVTHHRTHHKGFGAHRRTHHKHGHVRWGIKSAPQYGLLSKL